MIKGILTSILSLCTFSFFAQDADSLLTIEELYSLRKYAICDIPESDSFIVRDPLTSEQITDFSTQKQGLPQHDLLPLDALISLEKYSITYHSKEDTFSVRNIMTDEQIRDYSIVRSAIFHSDDYLMKLSHDDFPNLISLELREIYVNEMIEISKLTKLQQLDMTWRCTNDDNSEGYKLFFPAEFWELQDLQILGIVDRHLSDISENISKLTHLKSLNIRSHKSSSLVIPWSLFLMEELQLLTLPIWTDEKYFDPLIPLLKQHAHFTVRNELPLSLSNGFLENEILTNGNLNHFSKERKYTFDTNELILISDSITLTLNLNSDHTMLNGTSRMEVNNEVIEQRTYRNGSSHGKWTIQRFLGKEIRHYKNGQPNGRWHAHRIRYSLSGYKLFPFTTLTHRKNGRKIILRFNWQKWFYINYNSLHYFERLEEQMGIDINI